MNAGRNLKKAIEQALANAKRSGSPRYVHVHGGVYWVETSRAGDGTVVRSTDTAEEALARYHEEHPPAELLKSTGQIDVAAQARYVAREARAMRRLRDRGHRDWVGVSDAKIQELAEALGRINAQHFRVMKPVR